MPQLVCHIDAQNAARKAHGHHHAPPFPGPKFPCSVRHVPQKPSKQGILNEDHGPQQHVVGFVNGHPLALRLAEVFGRGWQHHFKQRQYAKSVGDGPPCERPVGQKRERHNGRNREACSVLQNAPRGKPRGLHKGLVHVPKLGCVVQRGWWSIGPSAP